MGLVLNFSPIQFYDRKINAGRLAYGATGKPANLESVKTRIKDDLHALVEQQSFLNAYPTTGAIPIPGFLGAHLESDLNSLLKRGRRERRCSWPLRSLAQLTSAET